MSALELALARSVAGGAPAIPGDVAALAARHAADLVAVALAAANAPEAARLEATLAPSAHGARAWSSGRMLALPDAALLNGFLAHLHDFDDDEVEFAMAHVTVTALTAALTLADAEPDITGARVISAYVLGFETATRLGRLVNPALYRRGWHASAALGVFAAAAAASSILRLPAEETRHALGLAASFAGGIRANFGSDAKPLQVGLAVRNGIMAALWARAGLTATPGSLLGPHGFAALFDGPAGAQAAVEGFGVPYDLAGASLTMKAFPACTATHSAVDAILALRRAHGLAGPEILAIEATVDPHVPGILIHDRPTTPAEAKFSLPYCLATAALTGALGLEAFTAQALARADVRALMEHVRVKLDPDLPKGPSGASVSAAAALVLADGTRLSRFVEHVPGSAARRLDDAALFAKFHACTRLRLGEPAARALFTDLLALHEPRPVRPLLDALCGAPGPSTPVRHP